MKTANCNPGEEGFTAIQADNAVRVHLYETGLVDPASRVPLRADHDPRAMLETMMQLADNVRETATAAARGSATKQERIAFRQSIAQYKAYLHWSVGEEFQADKLVRQSEVASPGQLAKLGAGVRDQAAALAAVAQEGSGAFARAIRFMDQQIEDQAVAAFMGPVEKNLRLYGGGIKRLGYEIFMNSVLSNPVTHFVNMLGNGAMMAREIPAEFITGFITGGATDVGRWRAASMRSRAVSSAMWTGLNDARRLARRQAELSFRGPDGQANVLRQLEEDGDLAMLRELQARTKLNDDLRVETQGVLEGWYGRKNKNMFDGMAKGVSKTVNYSTLALKAEDVFFKTWAYRTEIHSSAMRRALEAGGDAQQVQASYLNFLKEPPNRDLHLAAVDKAELVTFTGQMGEQWQSVASLIDKVPFGKYQVPFKRTIGQIFIRAVESVPGMGFLSRRHREMWNAGGEQRARLYAEQGLGSALLIGAAALHQAGYVTGGRSRNPQFAKVERETKRPMSVKIGDAYQDYSRIGGPIAILLPLAAMVSDVYSAVSSPEEEVLAEDFLASAGSFIGAIADQTWLDGLHDLNELIFDSIYAPERVGGRLKRFGTETIGSIVPLSAIRRTADYGMQGQGRQQRSTFGTDEPEAQGFDRFTNEWLDALWDEVSLGFRWLSKDGRPVRGMDGEPLNRMNPDLGRYGPVAGWAASLSPVAWLKGRKDLLSTTLYDNRIGMPSIRPYRIVSAEGAATQRGAEKVFMTHDEADFYEMRSRQIFWQAASAEVEALQEGGHLETMSRELIQDRMTRIQQQASTAAAMEMRGKYTDFDRRMSDAKNRVTTKMYTPRRAGG